MRSFLAALFVCAAVGAPAAAHTTSSPAPQQPPAPAVPPAPADPQPPMPDPATQPPTAGEPSPAQSGRVLAADAGLIFFPVKVDRTADFEKIMAKLKEALAVAQDPVQRQQAAGWKVFKAVEPGPNGTALYVFLIDPAVKGGDYAFWKTLYNAFPEEVQQLYRLYTAATAGGQSLLNLQLVQDFRTPD